jgi:hypothetical protein
MIRRPSWPIRIGVLLLALATLPVVAEVTPPKRKKPPKQTISPKRKITTKANQPQRAVRAPRAMQKNPVRVTGPSPTLSGSQPKWRVENSTIEMEPIWQGGTLQCSWAIKNMGDADLNIRARGG